MPATWERDRPGRSRLSSGSATVPVAKKFFFLLLPTFTLAAVDVELPLTVGYVNADMRMQLASSQYVPDQDGSVRQLSNVQSIEGGIAPALQAGAWRFSLGLAVGAIVAGESRDDAYATTPGRSADYAASSSDVTGEVWQMEVGIGWTPDIIEGLRLGPTLRGAIRRESIDTGLAQEYRPTWRPIPDNFTHQQIDWYTLHGGVCAAWDLPHALTITAEGGLRLARARGEIDWPWRSDLRHPGIAYRGSGWGWATQAEVSWTGERVRTALVAGVDSTSLEGDGQVQRTDESLQDISLTALDRMALGVALHCGLRF
jgi:hypothetical protein